MYYEISYSQLDWNKDINLESQYKDLCCHTMYSEKYWQTRSRRNHFKTNVMDYIIAAAIEEENLLFAQRLDLTSSVQ